MDTIPQALRAFYGDGTGGERECIARVVEKIDKHFTPLRCDSESSDLCVRCGAVYLARVLRDLLKDTKETAAAELAIKQAKHK